jgi:hypothetical protein
MRHLKKPSPAMVVACLSLFVALSGATYAATGGNFILGQANTATTQTSLSSSNTAAPTLNLVNTGGRPAARFQANGGKAVFTVSNSTKIANLNADLVDGLDSTQLQRTGLIRSARIVQNEDQGFLTIFRWPELGVMISGDGDLDQDGEFVVWNERASGFIEVASPGGFSRVDPGRSFRVSNPGATITVFIVAQDDPSRSLVVTCAQVSLNIATFARAHLFCQGVGNRTD